MKDDTVIVFAFSDFGESTEITLEVSFLLSKYTTLIGETGRQGEVRRSCGYLQVALQTVYLYTKRNKNFQRNKNLNLCYYYMKYLNYRETLYSSLILFQKEAEQRSTRTLRFRATKTPLWDSLS